MLDDIGHIYLFNQFMFKSHGDFRGFIENHFKNWGFTGAESDIGLMILRGYSLRSIAEQRGTSETTIRQQALSVYKKASVEGRHQLSAFFIEHLLQNPSN